MPKIDVYECEIHGEYEFIDLPVTIPPAAPRCPEPGCEAFKNK